MNGTKRQDDHLVVLFAVNQDVILDTTLIVADHLFKCGTGTAYKIVSIFLKSTYFCTEDVFTEIDIICTKVDCTDILEQKVTVRY